MPVKMNLGMWGSVFAVPSAIVDEHIKLASPSQLKIILFLLRNSGKSYTYKEIGDTLSIHEDDVRDSVAFWVERGLISDDKGTLSPSASETSEPVKETKEHTDTPEKKFIPTRAAKPDIVTVSQRMAADEELRHLVSEVELVLGDMPSHAYISTIIMLRDTCGLPAEVILHLVNYCKSIGKLNANSIDRIGVKWANDGINTIEAADNRIRQIHQSNMNWTRISSVFGLKNIGSPTAKQLEFADRWIGEWHFSDEMLRAAYETCVDNTGKMSNAYINKVLNRWYNAGVFKVEDIAKLDKKKPVKKTKSDASYDIEELEKIV